MSSIQSGQQSKGVPGTLVVLGLFVSVIAIFLLVFYGSRPKISGGGSDAGDRAAREALFIDTMNTGKNYLDQGRAAAEKAIEVFKEARAMNNASSDALLNLANAYLLANQAQEASEAARAATGVDRQDPAGHYLLGCSLLRMGEFEEALKSLQTAKDLDHTINAVSFQLGRAHQGLAQWEEAEKQFREVAEFDPEHGAVFYNLSQVLVRLGNEAEAEKQLTMHQQVSEKLGAVITDPSVFEKCIYTEARVPFRLDQPDTAGVSVAFVDATSEILGDLPSQFQGPVGVMDIGHDGTLDLFARHKEEGFQLLLQREGEFVPEGFPYPALDGAEYSKCLVGDLQHKTSLMGGRQEDVVLLSDKGTQVFRVSPSGMLSDSSLFAQIAGVTLSDGLLTDLDTTGKLDLIGLSSTNRSLLFLRNQGNFSFINHTSSTNLPTSVDGLTQFFFEDWDGDDRADLCLVHPDRSPTLWLREREGGFVESETFASLPAASFVVMGDLNNDLRADVVSLSGAALHIMLQGEEEAQVVQLGEASIDGLELVDYDNDGWLDVIGLGGGKIRTWRNRGLEGFLETSSALGLDSLELGTIADLKSVDLDGDCDSDFLLTLEDQSLMVLRNEGGNANQQLKLRLEGNRSNPSALGVKVEITSGGLRLIRTIHELPVEIGLGKRDKVDAIDPHWSDLVTTTDFALEDCSPLAVPELELPTGSCPYLYVWDGERFRFVTDLLGAAPLGLPVAAGKLIAADPDEFVWLGDESMVQPVEDEYVLQITEELREVLYLDEAKLVVVDHPAGVEVFPTSKLVPRPPFPKHELVALHAARELRSAKRSDGKDVTNALRAIDGEMLSPVALRAPQLRGLAEAYSVELDFGELPVERPLVLAMNGWLRFGGGMANIGASHNPDLPFPFPVLAVENGDGEWEDLDVMVGAPAGKTKAMIVDLEGKLPAGTKRLRLSMAFEIHWDRITLMEKYDGEGVKLQTLAASSSDLHWRGFSEYEELPWHQPLTPNYGQVKAKAPWLITPTGWCTRYGPVDSLIADKDDRLVVMNGGDELTLRFDRSGLAERAENAQRDVFLFTSGWDKDADPHVVQGWTVKPLPWHGMDDQQYGVEERPVRAGETWQEKFNTRWVGQFTLERRPGNARP